MMYSAWSVIKRAIQDFHKITGIHIFQNEEFMAHTEEEFTCDVGEEFIDNEEEHEDHVSVNWFGQFILDITCFYTAEHPGKY